MRTNRHPMDYRRRERPPTLAELDEANARLDRELNAAALLPDAEAELLAIIGEDELWTFHHENEWFMKTFREKYALTEAKISQAREELLPECNCYLPEQSCHACRPEPWDGETELEF